MKAPDPAARLAELLSRPLVKICGLTREEDVAAAAAAGADMAGFILADTPRRADHVLPVPDTMLSVAVYVGQRESDDADLAQLHTLENGHRSREAQLLRGEHEVARVRDLPWHGDDADHWQKSAAASGTERTVLAGGLDAASVREAIEVVAPWAVDVARGVESGPGIKDHQLVREFVRAVRDQSRETK